MFCTIINYGLYSLTMCQNELCMSVSAIQVSFNLNFNQLHF